MRGNQEALLTRAKRVLPEIARLQRLGLICLDGDFVPSVHYPPITQYPEMTEEEVYSGYTQPADGKLDIYAHFPFCEQHCLFCHYPGKVGRQTEEKEKYIGYLKREIDLYRERFGINRITPRSILFGGGTPTYLDPWLLDDFLTFFNDRVDVSKCTQFNYDVDPGTLIGEDGRERLRIMRDHGVTRLTIGVQSLDDRVLQIMNRPHTAAMAVEAIENTREFGFDLNIEFIYGHPGETYENWIETIESAVLLPVDEIQIYRLKVLAYGDFQGGIIHHRAAKPSFEETLVMKRLAIDIMAEHGFTENLRRVYTREKRFISHYAFNQCCNLYDQVGFGLTGFSSYRDRFTLNTQYFEEYYGAIDRGRLPMSRGYVRNPEQQMRWSIVLPLKNMDIRKRAFERMNGVPFSQVFPKKVHLLKEEGLLVETPEVVRLTQKGAFVTDEVVEQFNASEFMPFPIDRYADGPLNPYKNNTTEDAYGIVANETAG